MSVLNNYTIDTVEISNIRSYQTDNNILRLSPKLNVIMGKNGAGKTTILEALTFGLAGREPESTKRQEWANNTLPAPFEAGVKLVLRNVQTGQHQKLNRLFNYMNNKGGTTCNMSNNTEVFDTYADEGLLKYCLFCQEQYADWMFGTEANTYKIFNQLLNTEKYFNFSKSLNCPKYEIQSLNQLRDQAVFIQKKLYNDQQKRIHCQEIQQNLIQFQQLFQQFSKQTNNLQQYFLSEQEIDTFTKIISNNTDNDVQSQIKQQKIQMEQQQQQLELLKEQELQQKLNINGTQCDLNLLQQIFKQVQKSEICEIKLITEQIISMIQQYLTEYEFGPFLQQIMSNKEILEYNHLKHNKNFNSIYIKQINCQYFQKLIQQQINEHQQTNKDINNQQQLIIKFNNQLLIVNQHKDTAESLLQQFDQIQQNMQHMRQLSNEIKLQMQQVDIKLQELTQTQNINITKQNNITQQLKQFSTSKQQIEQYIIQNFTQIQSLSQYQEMKVIFDVFISKLGNVENMNFSSNVKQLNFQLKTIVNNIFKESQQMKSISVKSISQYKQQTKQLFPQGQENIISEQLQFMINNVQGLCNNKDQLEFLKDELSIFMNNCQKDNTVSEEEKIKLLSLFCKFLKQFTDDSKVNNQVLLLKDLVVFSDFYQKNISFIKEIVADYEQMEIEQIVHQLQLYYQTYVDLYENVQVNQLNQMIFEQGIDLLIQSCHDQDQKQTYADLKQKLNQYVCYHNKHYQDITYILNYVKQPIDINIQDIIVQPISQCISDCGAKLQQLLTLNSEVQQQISENTEIQKQLFYSLNENEQKINKYQKENNQYFTFSKQDLDNRLQQIRQEQFTKSMEIEQTNNNIQQLNKKQDEQKNNQLFQDTWLNSLLNKINIFNYNYFKIYETQINQIYNTQQHDIWVTQSRSSELKQSIQYLQNQLNQYNDFINQQQQLHNFQERIQQFNTQALQLFEQFSIFKSSYQELLKIFKLYVQKDDLVQIIDIQIDQTSNVTELYLQHKHFFIELQKCNQMIQKQVILLQERTRTDTLEVQIKQQHSNFKEICKQLSNTLSQNLIKQDLILSQKLINEQISKYQISKLEQINSILLNLWSQSYQKNADLNQIEFIQLEQSEKAIQCKVQIRTNSGIVQRNVRTGLSSGQRVMFSILLRVAFAKAFSTTVQTLCLDEPTNFLDERNADALAAMLGQFVEDNELQIIVITHSISFKNRLVNYSSLAKVFNIVSDNAGSRIIDVEEDE